MSNGASKWARRLVTVTLYGSLCLLVVVGLPVWLAAAAAVDLARGGRWPTVRCLLFLAVYLVCEVAGVLASLLVWALSGVWAGGDRQRFLRWNFRLQRWWARTLYRGAEGIFAMRTVVEGDEAVRRGPFILFARHASLGDTALPAVLIADGHGIMLRYIMKRELLWDPCLDIVGNRLPNYFILRGSGESAKEVAAAQRLMDDLGPTDGVLIFPEGTRFTPAKRDRAVTRLEGVAAPHLLAMARSMRHVLPPRVGGALGLLEKNTAADAVICAHTGLEGAATVRDLINGSLIGQTVRVAFWRIPFDRIPTDRDARATWLYEEWLRVDEWIARARSERTAMVVGG